MKIALLAAVSALVGGLAGGWVIYLAVQDRAPAAERPSRAVAPQTSGGPGVAPMLPSADGKAQVAEADRLAAAGKLREAQEAYLTVLLINPDHDTAMRGLVRVVRLLARGNRAVMRRQAEELRRAIAAGQETEEHYTPAAMEILMRANLLAAGDRPPALRREVVRTTPPSAARPASPPAVRRAPTPSPRPAQRQSDPAPAPPRSQPRPPAAVPQPAPAPPSPAPAPMDPNEPFFTVAVGPITSGDRAAAIGAELTIAGFTARVQRQGAGSFVIIVGPYRQSEARRAADHIRNRFGQSVPIALAPVRGGN